MFKLTTGKENFPIQNYGGGKQEACYHPNANPYRNLYRLIGFNEQATQLEMKKQQADRKMTAHNRKFAGPLGILKALLINSIDDFPYPPYTKKDLRRIDSEATQSRKAINSVASRAALDHMLTRLEFSFRGIKNDRYIDESLKRILYESYDASSWNIYKSVSDVFGGNNPVYYETDKLTGHFYLKAVSQKKRANSMSLKGHYQAVFPHQVDPDITYNDGNIERTDNLLASLIMRTSTFNPGVESIPVLFSPEKPTQKIVEELEKLMISYVVVTDFNQSSRTYKNEKNYRNEFNTSYQLFRKQILAVIIAVYQETIVQMKDINANVSEKLVFNNILAIYSTWLDFVLKQFKILS